MGLHISSIMPLLIHSIVSSQVEMAALKLIAPQLLLTGGRWLRSVLFSFCPLPEANPGAVWKIP
eukprot:466847-Karenia_brevis.AAC.1